jgi:hypothetical protein
MASGESALQASVDRIALSLTVNPHWSAAADFAGIHPETLRLWRRRGEAYLARAIGDGDEELPQIDVMRRLAQARAWWGINRQRSLALLATVFDHLGDADAPYGEALMVWTQARSGGEHKLITIIQTCGEATDAKTGEPDYNTRLRAAHTLLKMGWPDRYGERVGTLPELDEDARRAELEAKVGPLLDELRRKRAARE